MLFVYRGAEFIPWEKAICGNHISHMSYAIADWLCVTIPVLQSPTEEFTVILEQFNMLISYLLVIQLSVDFSNQQ